MAHPRRKKPQKKPRAAQSGDASRINVMVASQTWTRALRTVAAIGRRAAAAALADTRRGKAGEVNILLTSDAAVCKLNATYRGKDKATNVLSFPALSDEERKFLTTAIDFPLGDIAIAYGVTAREAKAEGKTLTAHVSHLVVHGVLHLLGYDHEGDDDAESMERLERKILARLGIADPYASHIAGTIPRGDVKRPKALPDKRK